MGRSLRRGLETDKWFEEYVDLSPEDYVHQADEYLKLGASIVGGCCGVFPEHIEAVASSILFYRKKLSMTTCLLLLLA